SERNRPNKFRPATARQVNGNGEPLLQSSSKLALALIISVIHLKSHIFTIDILHFLVGFLDVRSILLRCLP
ncbi:MAG: hypothetical protein OXC26_15035, partial [Albidovulum sp.]|nr:hypothetical protein [Albidovulum sp.]